MRAYVNAPDDPASTGRALGVNVVIDTRFVATADRIKVSVHLIRSEDGTGLLAIRLQILNLPRYPLLNVNCRPFLKITA